jgi:hypothetical protein
MGKQKGRTVSGDLRIGTTGATVTIDLPDGTDRVPDIFKPFLTIEALAELWDAAAGSMGAGKLTSDQRRAFAFLMSLLTDSDDGPRIFKALREYKRRDHLKHRQRVADELAILEADILGVEGDAFDSPARSIRRKKARTNLR